MRAANQGNADARARVGDLYYYGYHQNTTNHSFLELNFKNIPFLISKFLSPTLNINPDLNIAIQHYLQAAEGEYTHSAYSMFSLGYFYDYGIGVEKVLFFNNQGY